VAIAAGTGPYLSNLTIFL